VADVAGEDTDKSEAVSTASDFLGLLSKTRMLGVLPVPVLTVTFLGGMVKLLGLPTFGVMGLSNFCLFVRSVFTHRFHSPLPISVNKSLATRLLPQGLLG
jgi:hypothetical protein